MNTQTHSRTRRAALAALVAVLASSPRPALAQDTRDSVSAAARLAPVSVTVTRETPRSPFEVPFATSRLTPDATRPGLRRTSLSELLFGAPGVVVQDRANPSQDPRISIRGFGARSAFGVRGVRVLRDGIPLSLPDGQTPVDWLDLETIGNIDVVRGTAAALYGNAAGGVVDFRSREPDRLPFALSARALTGGGVTRSNLTASGSFRLDSVANASTQTTVRNGGWLASATSTRGDGLREWSRLEASSAFARAFAVLRGNRVELQATHYDAPRAENTGALTADELARDPLLPDSLNITKRSRKAVRHSQLALLASRTRGANDISLNAFVSSRTLDNPLPFAIVAVDRAVAGASLRATRRIDGVAWPLRLSAGIDHQRQDDARSNFENCADVLPDAAVTVRCPQAAQERGALRLDQQELVQGTGIFARAEVELPGRLLASAALRNDRVHFTVEDRFVSSTNADDSGERTLSANSPMVGLVWRAKPLLSLYANVARAFETPTITELTNQVDGTAGLNRTLAPQRTQTAEVGLQAIVANRVRTDVALFRARVQDELVPFDVPNAPGRRAFRNAGRTTRTGVEASGVLQAERLDAGVAYTWSDFRFDEYVSGTSDFAGNVIPGVPVHQLQAYGTVRWRGWFGTADVMAASRASANDASSIFAAGYATWGLRAGYQRLTAGRYAVEPILGVDNVFDQRYAASVVVNATRGRSFEPGGPRRAYLGLRLAARP